MMTVSDQPGPQQAERRAAERRLQGRYPLAVEISYAVLDDARRGETRAGQTIDLSSSALRFTAADPLALGTRVEIAMNWPRLRNEYIPMQLVATAAVIRTCGKETVVRIERHAFNTL